MNFNSQLKSIRKRYKVTQKTLAEYLGVTVRTYQRYEEGTIEPSISTITTISNFFDLPTDCLLANGFFNNWEDVLGYKADIYYALKKYLPNVAIDLNMLTESDLAKILPGLFSKIEIDTEKNELSLFPLIPPKD